MSYSDSDLNGAITPDEIIEESNYYPFGLKQKGYNVDFSSDGNALAHPWKFGGKEYQEELDLDWYDITARNYDPALGRWLNIDPLAEQMRRHSPYNYAFDNPVYFIDPDGMMPFGFEDSLEKRKRNRQEDDILGIERNYLANGVGSDSGVDVANPNNPVQLEEVVVTGRNGGGIKSQGINFQDRYSGFMAQWQDATEGKFSSDHTLADLQWNVSYGDTFRGYSQAQLNAFISSIHGGQIAFLRGSYNLTASLLQDTGDGAMLVGYGLTLTGIGAPLGVPMMGAGKGMSALGGGMNAASAFANGDNTAGFIHIGSSVIGSGAGRLINRSGNLNRLSKSILEYNIRLKLSGTERLIDSQKNQL